MQSDFLSHVLIAHHQATADRRGVGGIQLKKPFCNTRMKKRVSSCEREGKTKRESDKVDTYKEKEKWKKKEKQKDKREKCSERKITMN